MLQISEIVKKTEEMFDLFNEHFYDNELTRPAFTVSPDGGSAKQMVGAASMKSGTPVAKSIGKSISAQNTLTAPSSNWPSRFYMKWHTFLIWFMASKM